ncbi:MAG TPA: DUF3536 domain-containing protein [Chloroflexota bacterium]|nr:DUF3536 domain-containing protein [Chloroflexota bacterium]
MTIDGHSFLCVHGHFYQPPREDPFTGSVPREPGAEPSHDFNEKIAADCYRPNAKLGNFGRMSFDLGPTLASWLERWDPDTYQTIIADERAAHRRDGHGNGLAQVYGHAIMPLATDREKRIQVVWGLADFAHRFGRQAEGMWLAETAADEATLGVLADYGVRFTVLAPWQAIEAVDASEPHWVRLADGRRIVAFFFHAELSGKVSFDYRATTDADTFGHHALPGYLQPDKEASGESQLILVASDGELYGHHQPNRDKFLSQLLTVSAPDQGFQITGLGRYLDANPPRREVTLSGRTSWSCHHGVDRWSGDCACCEGDGTWKSHLRQALVDLAARLDALYEATSAAWLRDPWVAEEEYIRVLLGVEAGDRFWERHTLRADVGRRQVFALLQSQHHRHLMFASCAWFFDDLDRIEPRYAIANGLWALRQAELLHRVDLISDYASALRKATSWRTGRTGFDLLHEVAARVPSLYQMGPGPLGEVRSEDLPLAV